MFADQVAAAQPFDKAVYVGDHRKNLQKMKWVADKGATILSDGGACQSMLNPILRMTGSCFRSTLNQWLTPDTLVPNPENPQSYNRFAYVNNNPIRFNDPTGFWDCEAGEDYDRCVSWFSDLLGMLANDGGEIAEGVYRWFLLFDQSLKEENGIGVLVKVQDNSLFNFDMSVRNGDTIRISREFFNEATNYSKAALLAHELTHLQQGSNIAFSKVGESAAYYMQALVQNEFTPLLEGSRLLQLKDFIELDYSDYPDQSKQFSEWLVDFQWPYFFVPKYPATIDGNTATQLIVAPAQFFSVLGSNSSSSTYMSPRIPQ